LPVNPVSPEEAVEQLMLAGVEGSDQDR